MIRRIWLGVWASFVAVTLVSVPASAQHGTNTGDLLDIRAEIEPGNAAAVVLKLHGETIKVDVKKKEIQCRGKKADLQPSAGRIKLQVLLDRASLEIFGNDGQRCLSFCFPLDPKQTDVELSAEGGTATVPSLEAYELSSTWRKDR